MAAPKDEESAHAFVRARQRGCLTNSQRPRRVSFVENGVHRKDAPKLSFAEKCYFTKRKEPMAHHSSLAPSMKSSTDLNLVSVHELFEHTQDVFNLIARRAFEAFESRGYVHGNDREDWFLAESELLTPVKFHLSESGEQLRASAEVPGFNRGEIKVSLEPHRLSISGKTEPREDHKSEKQTHSFRPAQLMFCVIDLPTEVDLSKAKATFNDGALGVVMPKVAPAKSIRAETKLRLSAESDTSVPEIGGVKAASSPLVVSGANEPMVKAQATASRK
jgi:HSP20 family molecular chaperone IbpA